MKITNKQLKKIIKEELRNLILESSSSDERVDFFIQHLIETISTLVYAQPKDFNEDESFFDSHAESFLKLMDVGILNNYRRSSSENETRFVIDFVFPEQDRELNKKIEDAYLEYVKTANPKMTWDDSGYNRPTQIGKYCIVEYEYLWYSGRITIDIIRKK